MAKRQKEIKSGSKPSGKGSSTHEIVTKLGAKEENNNKSQLMSGSSRQEKVQQQSKMELQNNVLNNDHQTSRSTDSPLWSSSAEHSSSQNVVLSIKLNTSPIIMEKTSRGKKLRFKFQSISELSTKLTNYEEGREIWLTVSGVSSNSVKKFLKKFANVISNLTLSYSTLDDMSPSDFQKLLIGLPNLNYLYVPTLPAEWIEYKELFPQQNRESPKANKSCLLPQINSISFGSSYGFYPEFLRSFFQMLPNLKNIYNFPLNCIPDSADDHMLKIDKIKSVNFFSVHVPINKWVAAELSDLEYISEEIGLQAAHLKLPLVVNGNEEEWLWDNYFGSLYGILEKNQNTLEYLLLEPFAYPESLEYPEMKAVKKLCLFAPRDLPIFGNAAKLVKFFGEGFNVGEVFPNLEEVTLEGACTLDNFLTRLPEDAFTQSYFKGVTSLNLKLDRFVMLESLEKTVRLFPNVTRLVIKGHIRWNNGRLAEILRLWPKLISLKVSVYLTDFDAMCHRKFEMPNMTGLKELAFIVSDSDRHYQGTPAVEPKFSHNTPLGAFQSVPNLRVTCCIAWDDKNSDKLQEILSPIKKHATFNPNYFEPLAHYEKFLL